MLHARVWSCNSGTGFVHSLVFQQRFASMPVMGKGIETDQQRAARIRAIEADLAFFETCLAFASRDGDSPYKQAQRRTFESLKQSLGQTLRELRGS